MVKRGIQSRVKVDAALRGDADTEIGKRILNSSSYSCQIETLCSLE